jgi:hypothetical protein
MDADMRLAKATNGSKEGMRNELNARPTALRGARPSPGFMRRSLILISPQVDDKRGISVASLSHVRNNTSPN